MDHLKSIGFVLGAAFVGFISTKIGVDAISIFAAIAVIAIVFNILKFIFKKR